eukprot:PhF_6_TR43391/c0_g1_i1/m.66608
MSDKKPPTPTGDKKPPTPTTGDKKPPTPTGDKKPPTPTGDKKPPTPTTGDKKPPTPTPGDKKPPTPTGTTPPGKPATPAGHSGSEPDDDPPDSPFNKPQGAHHDQIAGARPGLTAAAELQLGFSPVRANKSKKHILDVDPRTKLKIISIPPELRKAFSDLQDCIIHICSECFRVTKDQQLAERILIITDQTVFLCSSDGRVARCIQIDKIHRLYISRDNKALALEVPVEYDLVLMFRNMNDRDKAIKVIRTIYKRMVHGTKLEVELVKKGRTLDPHDFRTQKPGGFKVRLTPQRTKEQLLHSLEVFEAEEEAMLQELDMIQDEMEASHQQTMAEKQQDLESMLHQLREVVRNCWENEKSIEKLEVEVEHGKKLISSVDGSFGPEGQLPPNKDARIAELERIVERLNAAVFNAQTDQQRRSLVQPNPGSFFDKDLLRDIFDPKWPVTVPPGQLAHMADLLQTQLVEKQKELDTLKNVNDKINHTLGMIDKLDERMRRIASGLNRQERDDKAQGRTWKQSGGASGGHGGGASPRSAPEAPTGDILGSDPDSVKPWLLNVEELTPDMLDVDPRTDLRIIDIPESMKTYFPGLQDAILHFFAVVKKTTKQGQIQKRICIISDQSVYTCSPDGDILRCVDIANIDEIVLDAAFTIGLRDSSTFDLMFTCASPDHRQEIIDILQRIYGFLTNGKTIRVRHIQRFERMEAQLNLMKPPHLDMTITPVRDKSKLVEAIKAKRNKMMGLTSIKEVAVPTGMDIPPEKLEELKHDVLLQLEHEWRQDPALIQLRRQLDTLDDQIHMAVEEAHLLRRRIEEHKCEDNIPLSAPNPGSGVMPAAGPGVFRPNAKGFFFVPTEPVQIDCSLDVQKVFLWDTLLFTGHVTGIVSVWDLEQNCSFLRNLKDHMSRVTTMQYDGTRLITGSHDSSIRLWDIRSGRCKSVLSGHRGYVNHIQFQGDKLLSSGADALIHVWDLHKEMKVQTLTGHKTAIVSHKFQQNMVVSIDWGWMLIWDLREPKPVRTLQDQYGGLRCLDVEDNLCVTGGTGGDVSVWNISKGSGETMQGHDDDVHCVQLQGRYAVTSGGDCKIRHWDVDQMKALGVFHESYPYDTKSFHMRGNRFAASQGQYVMLWTK